ncbi:MAG: GtrA family protein [Oscillospiraceae bacterium]|nr:GtrA family protein [Oscillospiraceae bacterium]
MLNRFFELLKKGDIKGIMLEPTEDGFLQFFRYIFVGGASFVVDWALLQIIEAMGVYHLIAGIFSFIAGLCVNFGLSKLLVFSQKSDKKQATKEFTVFGIIVVFGLLITEGLMWIFVDKMGIHLAIAKIIAAGIVLFWNFFMKKLLLYRKK